MSNTDTLRKMLVEVFKGSPTAKVAECLLNAKGKFMTITMKPDASDAIKRDGKQRVYHLNIAEQWLHWEKKHGLGDGKLKEVAIAGLRTKFLRGEINVCESVHGDKGWFTRQCRCINLHKIESIRYSGQTYRFA